MTESIATSEGPIGFWPDAALRSAAIDLEQCALFVESAAIRRAMVDGARILRAMPGERAHQAEAIAALKRRHTEELLSIAEQQRGVQARRVAAAVQRMRAYLLEALRTDLRHGDFHSSELIAVLSEVPPSDAWRAHDAVADPRPDGWYLWRDPRLPNDIHADKALVENGKIISKWGCGITFFTECVPLELPTDVAAILADNAGREAPGG